MTTQDTNSSREWSTSSNEKTTPEDYTTPGERNTTIDVPTAELSPGAIAGIAVGCAVVILVLLAVIFRKKLAKLFCEKHRPNNYIQKPQVKPNRNSIFDELHAAEEFKKLFDYKSKESQTAGLDPKNISENRFKDIVPYDFNRVKLDRDIYINASHIEPYFIATQDPMMNHIELLWQMVWESQVATIVRLSPEEEGAATDSNDGRVPVAVYFPPLEREWVVRIPAGDMSVKTIDVQRDEAFTKTELALKLDGSTRQVTHYHIQDWRDDKYPSATATWNTINKIRETNPSRDRKVLVHCGAGAGRTGTFIAVWMLGESHRLKKDTSILDICLRLRDQRPGMVTIKYQYDYIYKCAKVLVDGPLMMHV